jgi:hypothetical protein
VAGVTGFGGTLVCDVPKLVGAGVATLLKAEAAAAVFEAPIADKGGMTGGTTGLLTGVEPIDFTLVMTLLRKDICIFRQPNVRGLG